MNETPGNLGMQTKPLDVVDFKGGMTDFYLGAPLDKFKTGDNLLIVKYGDIGKLETRPGSNIYNSTYYQIPAGAQRIGTLKYFLSTLLIHSSRKLYYINSGWQTLQGPTGNDLFPTGTDTTVEVSLTTWNKHLFVCSSTLTLPSQIFQNGSGTWKLLTAGLPALASAPTVSSSGGTGKNYLYRFVYAYTYTSGTQTFTVRGPATEVAKSNIGEPSANNVTITPPVLSNSTTYNYDTAAIYVEVYRTTDGGSNFFYAGHVLNNAGAFTDNVSDATLQNNEPLYTEGGEPDNDPPPAAKVVHVCGDIAYYGYCVVGSDTLKNRILQSVPGAPYSVPATFYTDLQDEIVGISSFKSVPIVACVDIVYRLDGAFDFLGGGFISPQKISDTAGCVSSQSMVQTPEGVFWAGKDGFYWTDGYNVLRISDGIRTTYKSLVSTATRRRRITGKYDSTERRIWWTVQYAASATDCDACFVLDLNWGISEDMPFTTASGGANFAPTALEFIDADMVRADTRGYVFLHTSSLTTDPKVDTGTAPTNWETATIIHDYVSVATNFGTSAVRKWVTGIVVNTANDTNLSLAITSINDDGRTSADCKPIRYRGNVTWGDPDVYWGDPDVTWNFQGLGDNRRRMPASAGLRCEYKQIELTNAHVAIVSSDVLGTADVNATTHQATLTDSATRDWPSTAVDYYIAFERDSYTREYLITARSADTLTFADSDGTAQTATGSKWVIRGRPRGEVLNLIGYTLDYALLGQTQAPFDKNSTGEPSS